MLNEKSFAGGVHLRSFNLLLFLTGWLLSFRSRQGFFTLLAVFRLLGLSIVLLRFAVYEDLTATNPLATWVGLGVVLPYSLVLLFPGLGIRKDTPWFYALTIFLDTLAINYAIAITGNAASELYVLLFLPLVTAAHFLNRRPAVLVAFGIVGSYLVLLWQYFPYDDLFRDALLPWIGKSFLLMAGTWLYRVQRSLPRTNESWVISPAHARTKLERWLRDLQKYVPYDTVSVQLLYRDRLQIVACQGFSNAEEIYQIEFPIDDDRYPNYLVLKTHQPQIVPTDDYPSFQEEHYFARHIKSWMGVPLISPSTAECFGMISIDSSHPGAYDRRDMVQAGWFAKKVSNFLIEAALGPAALTQATSRENLLRLLKLWASVLPNETSKWEDDLQAAQELAGIGQMIFRTEDCSILFQRQMYVDEVKEPVLHLVASTSVPADLFKQREIKVTGQHRDGLTGLAVHRNRTINYGALQVSRSPYRAGFTQHLQFMFSRRCRQVMISPLRDSKGNAIGAVKIENRMGVSSEKPFYPVEKNVFEVFVAMVSLILETIRQRNYISRHDEGVHGLRGLVHYAAIEPLDELLARLDHHVDKTDIQSVIRETQHVLQYVKMAIHGLLSDSENNLYLEKEGLVHALHRYLKSLKDIPYLKPVCDSIHISAEGFRDHDMPYQVQEVFFNIAREGILNMVRHSKINQRKDGYGAVSLFRVKDTFQLVIQDNGVGFTNVDWEAEQKRSFGLNDMHKQIELIKSFSETATINIDPRPGQGTLIQVQWAPRAKENVL